MTDRKTWVISIPPVKCPDDMTGIPNYYIQIWEKYVGKVKPEGGDREDWIETCSRLYWGVRNLGEDAIVRVHGKTDIDPKQLIGLPHFGQVLDMPPIDQYADPSHADRYAINSNVRMLMHRKAKLSSIYEDDIKHAFASLIRDGVSSFFIKFMNQAKWLPNLKISGTNLDELEQQVQEWGGWAFVHADDDSNALLIQENVDVQYEYRMFMVGNQPVCGAGNIGLKTPIDNMHTRFDPQMQKIRDDTTVKNVELRPDLAERYREFATRAGRMFAHCGYGAYTLDLCLIKGEVSIVELNGLMNSGLFALNMNDLTSTLRVNWKQCLPPVLLEPAI